MGRSPRAPEGTAALAPGSALGIVSAAAVGIGGALGLREDPAAGGGTRGSSPAVELLPASTRAGDQEP